MGRDVVAEFDPDVMLVSFDIAPPVAGRSIGPVVPTPRGPDGLGLFGPWRGVTIGVAPLFMVPLFMPVPVPDCIGVPVFGDPALGPLLAVLLSGVPEPPPWAIATPPQASAAAAASVVRIFDVRNMSVSPLMLTRCSPAGTTPWTSLWGQTTCPQALVWSKEAPNAAKAYNLLAKLHRPGRMPLHVQYRDTSS